MTKLLIIDGHNLLFQMFFGMPNKFTNKDGKYIHGVIGFIGALRKIIDIVKPTNILVIFDGEHENERKDINEDYKANRPDYSEVSEEDNPFSQLEDIYKCLQYMKIPFYEADDCEADDVIATYALMYGDKFEIVISSFDSDFFQLVNKNVKILRYRGVNSVIIDDNYLQEKYNITAGRYSFFKSLVGDTADNIKGLTKIGLKTASKIVNLFSSIEEMYENIDKLENKKMIEIILNEKEKLINNYQIINLTLKGQLRYPIEELTCNLLQFKTNKILEELGIR